MIKTIIGSIQNTTDRYKAAKLMAEGNLVAVFNRGVNAIWLDAQNEKALDEIPRIKGQTRIGKPLSLTIGFEKLVHFIDTSKISQEGKKFIAKSNDLKNEVGSLCFLRFPIKKEYVNKLPKVCISYDQDNHPWVQNWDPHGHKQTEDFLKKAHQLGVKFAAVTSMNLSGEPEMVDQEDGENFCKKHSIAIYLKDPKVLAHVKGSYTIATFTKEGIELTREGNIPGRIIAAILGQKIVGKVKKLNHHPQMDFPQLLYQGLNPQGIRMAVLDYLNGKDPLEINSKLRQTRRYKV